MKAIIFTIAVTFLGLSSGQAQFANPEGTLKKFYEDATEPAEINDIDSIDATNSDQKCVWANSQNIGHISFRRGDIKTAGNKGFGPLFPGTPDGKKSYIIFDDNNNRKPGDLQEYVRQSQMYTTKTELVFEANYSQGFGDMPHSYKFRRNEKNLAVQINAGLNSNFPRTYYGYCYREQ